MFNQCVLSEMIYELQHGEWRPESHTHYGMLELKNGREKLNIHKQPNENMLCYLQN